MNANVRVIFSSINSPTDTIVQQSLERFRNDCEVYVITSERFSSSWFESKCRVQIAKFDSTSKSRVFVRKLFLRSQILQKILRFTLLHIVKNDRQLMMPPHNARHFEYLRAMEFLSPLDWVILVDSRDLIFQISPREVIDKLNKDIPIHLFAENDYFFKNGEVQKNDFSPANWNWANQLFNGNVNELEVLRGTNIVNAGCIVGRVEEMKRFLEKSCDLLSSSLHSSYALLDQASVNAIAYSLKNDFEIEIHHNGEIVLNMCGVVQEKVEIQAGKLYAGDKLIPVVHQFDRFGTWGTEVGLRFDKREYRIQ